MRQLEGYLPNVLAINSGELQ